MKAQEVVTLAGYGSLEEAQVIKALLDSMGIENDIVSGTVAQVMPYLEGDVRIVVNSADYKAAKDLLNAKFDKQEMVAGTRRKNKE